MRRLIAPFIAFVLTGCGVWTSTLRSDALDYNQVVTQSINRYLLVNILEAKDNGPIHFIEIPKINATLQATASLQAAVPFDITAEHIGTSTSYANGQTGSVLAIQSSPTFEIDNLDTKDFATGISSSIDPKFIQYWAGRGIDKRILFLLFFSSAQIIDTSFKPTCGEIKNNDKGSSSDPNGFTSQSNACRTLPDDATPFPGGALVSVRNDPRRAADAIVACLKRYPVGKDDKHSDLDPCHNFAEFELYLYIINSFDAGITANAYVEHTLVARCQELKSVSKLDPSKYELAAPKGGERCSKGSVDLNAISPTTKVALCYDGKIDLLTGNPAITSQAADNVCSKQVINRDPSKPTYTLPPATNLIERDYADADGLNQCFSDPNTSTYCGLIKGYFGTDHFHATPACSGGTEGAPEKCRTVLFTIRSVAEMFRYLGDLAYYQETLRKAFVDHSWEYRHHNIPLTIGFSDDRTSQDEYGPCHDDQIHDAKKARHCAGKDDGWLFNLNPEDAKPYVSVDYRGENYWIGDSQTYDHTLEVMTILTQLLDLNKSASDIRTTPIVQVVP